MLSSYVMASFVLAGLTVAHPPHNLTVSQPFQAATPNSAYTSFITSFIAPTGTIESFDGQISSPAQLSKRQQGDWEDVAATAVREGVSGAVDIISIIFGPHGPETKYITVSVPGATGTTTVITTVISEPGKPTGDEVTATITITQDPETTTVTQEPAQTDTPEKTVTTTVTQEPGQTEPGQTDNPEKTVTTTVTQEPGQTNTPEKTVTTTVTQEPGQTDTPEKTVTTTVVSSPDSTKIIVVKPEKSYYYALPGGGIGETNG